MMLVLTPVCAGLALGAAFPLLAHIAIEHDTELFRRCGWCRRAILSERADCTGCGSAG